MAAAVADLTELRRKEFGRSFDPREWYDQWDDADAGGVTENVIMWVYRPNKDTGMFDVGYFTPDREWVQESAHQDKTVAASRVHWLNGGSMST